MTFNDSLCNSTLEVIITNTMQVVTFDPHPSRPGAKEIAQGKGVCEVSLLSKRSQQRQLRYSEPGACSVSKKKTPNYKIEQLINFAAYRGMMRGEREREVNGGK